MEIVMALRTTERGLALIREFEGLRLAGYVCPAGVATIGYGHTEAAGGAVRYKDGTSASKVIVGRAITKAEAERILAADIDRFEDGVERAIGPAMLARLSPHQFDALVSLAFNIGLGAFGRSTVLKRIKAGRFDMVPAAIMMWVKAGGKTLPGLVRRRRAECALWREDPSEIDVERPAGYFGEMPQQVEKLPPPKSMAASKMGWASISTTAAGGVAAASELVDAAKTASETASSAWDIAFQVGPWVLLLVVIVAAGAFIWWDRRRKLYEDLV
jgi:lysozyme